MAEFGDLSVSVDAAYTAYKVTAREGDPERVQQNHPPELVLAITVSMAEDAEEGVPLSGIHFAGKDRNGYAISRAIRPPSLSSTYPSEGWEGELKPGQERRRTIGMHGPPERMEGITVTYTPGGASRSRATAA